MAGIRKPSEIRAARKQLRNVTAARRSIFFFMRTILTVLIVAAMCVVAFISSARISNAYILVNEGMPLRADCILKGASPNEMAAYFTSDCINNDKHQRETGAAPYGNATITSYEYSLSIAGLHLLPWYSDPYVVAVEQIRAIRGSLSADAGADATIPDWTPRKYRLHLERIDSRWYIGSVEQVELNPKIAAPATPDPDADPIPMATPTPTPLPSETPLP